MESSKDVWNKRPLNNDIPQFSGRQVVLKDQYPNLYRYLSRKKPRWHNVWYWLGFLMVSLVLVFFYDTLRVSLAADGLEWEIARGVQKCWQIETESLSASLRYLEADPAYRDRVRHYRSELSYAGPFSPANLGILDEYVLVLDGEYSPIDFLGDNFPGVSDLEIVSSFSVQLGKDVQRLQECQKGVKAALDRYQGVLGASNAWKGTLLFPRERLAKMLDLPRDLELTFLFDNLTTDLDGDGRTTVLDLGADAGSRGMAASAASQERR